MADRRLQVFSTVARLLSFTKAAKVLHMTQPAVTFQIRQLEEYFNTRLFDRTHKGITLTKAGEIVKSYSDQIITHYSAMDNAVRQLTGDVQGLLVLGASTTIGEYVVPSLLGDYQAKYPDVSIRLQVTNTLGVVHMVENNQVDIGIVEGPVHNKNLVAYVCWNDELVAVMPNDHPLQDVKELTLSEFLQYPFITREEGSGTREVINKFLADQNLDLGDFNLIMELGSPESIKSAVVAGLGVSILSIATLEKERKLHSLSYRSLSPQITRPFSIIYQRQKFRVKTIEEFLEFNKSHGQWSNG
ncbi:MAG: LysR family transcriptional regulator [Acidiferrobacteraceae bacterium]|nr:LysR family transcriptional regulator [Acidiferrobacteraceae bacterium]